jgi:hypothetical protein
MNREKKFEEFQSLGWWRACYTAFFGHAPGPEGSGYLVLVRNASSQAYFAVVASSGGNREAVEQAIAGYGQSGITLPAIGGVVYGPCRDADCQCEGGGHKIEFFLAR